MNDNNECYTYVYKFTDIFVPPIDIFKYLCESYDKTNLFLISFMRVLVILFIIYIYYDITKLNNIWIFGYFSLVIYMVINIIILFIIMLKNQKIEKKPQLDISTL